jgi:diguanylate cyclase (GGDEF)-like protein
MDIRTLGIVTCVCAATMATTLGVMSRLSPADRCLKDWTQAALLFLANSIFGVVVLSYDLHPHPVAVALANASTIAGYALMLSGVRRYLQRPSARQLALLLGLLTLVLDLLPGVRSHLEWRLLLGWPIIVGIHVAVVVELCREPRQLAKPAMKPLLALTLAYAVQQLLRLLVLAQAMFHGAPISLNDSVFTSGRLLMFVYLLLATMACALLVLQDKAEELKRHADVDPMTGWHNRRTWDDVMDAEFQRGRRTGAGFHVVMFDIDHFKAVNDRYGHDIGDQAIRHVAASVAQELRGYDRRFRIGGEEFVVCAPGLQAAVLAERIRARVASRPLLTTNGEVVLTVSVGYGDVQADDADWKAVAQRADQALYQAKRSGRNRVEGFCPPGLDLAWA